MRRQSMRARGATGLRVVLWISLMAGLSPAQRPDPMPRFPRGAIALPPPPTLPGEAPPGTPVDLNALAHQMALDARRLADDLASDLRRSPQTQHLIDDAQELGQAVDEFHEALHGGGGRQRAAQAYAGIDASWHHLQGELTRSRSLSPAVRQAIDRVAQTDARIHQALGINNAADDFYGGRPPTGMREIRRLTHSLVERAEALANEAGMERRGASSGRVEREAANLARAADAFHDALDLNGRIDETLRDGFSLVSGSSDRLRGEFRRNPPSPGVLQAWGDYRATEVLIKQALGIRVDPEDFAGTVLVPAGMVSPLVGQSRQLLGQSSEFVRVFSAAGSKVPEAKKFLADARALATASADFDHDVQRGLDPGRLAFAFRDVDAIWQRLARRTNRIAKGRSGPNIELIGQMGLTVGEIHRLLAMPGPAPRFAPPR